MMMAVNFLKAYFKICLSILRSLHMAMNELQDFPKIPSELMERLMKLTLRYFEERSGVSCMYLSFFLSAFILMLVSNPTVSSMIYIVAESVDISIFGRKRSPVTMQGESKPGRLA